MASYRDAGVDLEGAARHVKSIAADVTSTWTEGVIGRFGGFAAGVVIPPGYDNPVLMMSTDGVGTKLELARRSRIWDGVGGDLVAMCVDDLATVGATPIGFVDYLAVGALQPERDALIVRSIARACKLAGCPLLGGETAEHPGVMDVDAVDLAGAVAGIVERGHELGPRLVEEGDVIIGLHSPNLRSNGFSLVRRVFDDNLDEHVETLLEPSVIYSPAVLAAMATGRVHAGAHITGGGIIENLARALPPGLGATVDTASWEVPAVFGLIEGRGVDRDEMFHTFNMGIGFCLLAPPDSADVVMEDLSRHRPSIIGEVVSGAGVTLE